MTSDCPAPDACHLAECLDGGCVIHPRCTDDDPCTFDECDNEECQYRPWAQEFTAGPALLDDFEGELDHWHFSSDNPEVGWSLSPSWSATGATSLYLGNPTSGTYDHGPVSAAASRLVAAPQCDQAGFLRLGLLHHAAQVGGRDVGMPGGKLARQPLRPDAEIRERRRHPMKAAAWRYQSTRYGGM